MHVSDNHLGTLEFELAWDCSRAAHRERYLARKVNFWRDIFPPGMRRALEGLEMGRGVTLDYGPGRAVEPHLPRRMHVVDRRDFRAPVIAGRVIGPAVGRHFPLSLFGNLPGVFGNNARPGRITAMDERTMTVDANHPLSPYALSITATVLNLAEKSGDTGGRLNHWMEVLADGPGMQARDDDSPAWDAGEGLARLDETPDAVFYDRPRLVDHVDAQAREHLAIFMGEAVTPGHRVLDLMSSRRTHLPESLVREKGVTVTGLGLNTDEMAANPLLAERLVHDLNADPHIPLPDAAFDAVLCALSVEYLTRPQEVMAEAARVLRPGGAVVVGLSDRWFPTKVTRLWPDLHEFERQGLVMDWLARTGAFEGMETVSVRNWWRPVDDPHIRQTWTSDPVYVIRAVRKP